MLARVLLLWLVLLNLATAVWWWARPAAAVAAPMTVPVEAEAAATTPGLVLVRELPASAAPGLPPCPEPDAAAAQAVVATEAEPGTTDGPQQQDCVPLR